MKSIYYYKPVIYINDEPTEIHLTEIIDHVWNLGEAENKTRLVKNKTTWMIGHKYWEQNQNDSTNNPFDRGFSISINREEKPFVGRVNTDIVNPIDGDVLELTNCVYLSAHRLLMIEYNHSGARPAAVGEYLDKFLIKDLEGNNHWSLKLCVVLDNNDLLNLRQAEEIKKVTFKLNMEVTKDEVTNVTTSLVQNRHNFIARTFNSLFDIQEDIGGTKSEFAILKGRSSRNPLEQRNLIHTLEYLSVESEFFEAILIDFVKQDGSKKTINLKDRGNFKSFVELDYDAYEYSLDTINNHFFTTGRPGTNKYCDFPDNLVFKEGPQYY